MTWLQEGHFAYGLGPTANVQNDSLRVSVTVDTGVVPEDGATITNSTKSATAKYRGNSGGSGPVYLFFINESEKSTEDVWENTDSLTWTGGTGTMGADEIKNDVESSGFYWLRPVFSAPASPPAGIDYFMLFRLEENTGYYRALVDREDWDTTWSVSGEALDMSFFPYDHSSGDTYENPGELLPLWPGPYDADGLPETIMDALDSVQSVAWHKNCLFAAEGNIIRMSEPEKPCYFREAFSLDAGDDVLKMVSRDELLEVYTPTGIKYVVGASPYFELRETGITEGPVSRDSIVKTDVGTFALFDDGLYVVTGTARRNLTAGVNTPWLKAMAGAGDSVGGASQGIFYLCDTNGDVLAYDWDQDEFFNRTFSAQPAGFFYSDDRRALVAKVGGAFYEVGSSVSSIAWAISFGKQGDYRHRPVPGFASIDCDGEMILSVRVDGSLVRSYALDGTEDVPLPIDRGRFYQLGLSGTGTEADTEIRSLSTR
jgi:hypothetical protein